MPLDSSCRTNLVSFKSLAYHRPIRALHSSWANTKLQMSAHSSTILWSGLPRP